MAITVEPLEGNFCVVLKTDGTCEVKELEKSSDVFEKSYGYIGCDFLEVVALHGITPEVSLAFLVNENGYSDWDKDPAKVNKSATFLYNDGHAGHFVLGDVVFCLIVPGEDGTDIVGMSKLLANIVAKRTTELKADAIKEIAVPSIIPDPKIDIMSFKTVDDLIAYQSSDKDDKSKIIPYGDEEE